MPPDLPEIAADLLAHVEATFAAASIDLPDRRYVTVGGTDEAVECEQATVAWERIVPGQPGATTTGPQTCVTMRFAEFRVQVWRCHPADAISATSELQAAALAVLADARALATAGETAGDVLGEEWRDYETATTGTSALGPQGGYAGSQLLVQIPLP